MRLYFVKEKSGRSFVAAEAKGALVDLNAANAARPGSQGRVIAEDMISLIAGGSQSLEKAQRGIEFALASGREDLVYPFSELRLLAPIPRPGKIFCSGLNYKSHIEENPNAKFLSEPRFFSKAPSIVIGPEEPIRHPGEQFQVDWEVELGVVFGKNCYRVSEAEAMEYVFGYTILHDVSARYIQFKDNNEVMGKNFESFCPLGPCIVTADEIPHPEQLELYTRVDGRVVQQGTNRDWCFSLPHLIEWLSMAICLEPGDIVSTGTPAGVGLFHKPPVYLRPGNTVELEISRIGKLVNPVVKDEYKLRKV
jgi:2-keto-4-pentenoate hydratase/2-oxohepta-3-ene-1,7-dioic acid hydratase in catechol pathway